MARGERLDDVLVLSREGCRPLIDGPEAQPKVNIAKVGDNSGSGAAEAGIAIAVVLGKGLQWVVG